MPEANPNGSIVDALKKRLEGPGARKGAGREKLVEQLMTRGRRFATLPVVDSRPPEELVGCDEVGLPR